MTIQIPYARSASSKVMEHTVIAPVLGLSNDSPKAVCSTARWYGEKEAIWAFRQCCAGTRSSRDSVSEKAEH